MHHDLTGSSCASLSGNILIMIVYRHILCGNIHLCEILGSHNRGAGTLLSYWALHDLRDGYLYLEDYLPVSKEPACSKRSMADYQTIQDATPLKQYTEYTGSNTETSKYGIHFNFCQFTLDH
jgi:hypothetical protein